MVSVAHPDVTMFGGFKKRIEREGLSCSGEKERQLICLSSDIYYSSSGEVNAFVTQNSLFDLNFLFSYAL